MLIFGGYKSFNIMMKKHREGRMRIAYFTDTFTPEINGVTNTLSKLRNYLEKKNIWYTFFAPGYSRKAEELERSTEPRCGVEPSVHGSPLDAGMKRVYRFDGLRTKLSPGSCLAFPKTRNIFETCDAFKPDLVHVTTELGIGYRGMRYARSRSLPLVMSYHTDYGQYLRYFNLDFLKPLLEKYLLWFYGFAHKILAPSKYTLTQLFRKKYRNLGLWSRGIDSLRFDPQFRNPQLRKALGIGDKFVFLYVGRLSPEKGLDMLLHAARELRNRFPGKTAFVFTGGGPYEPVLREAKLDNIILTGFKSGHELSEMYASADCFAFPSGTETFGNAPLEAMASGLPVAGVSGGGVTEFLSHGRNALLCTGGDRDAFTENLVTIMSNNMLRRELVENGRREALARDWDIIFDELLTVYTTLIQNRQKVSEGAYRDAS
jgi:glycosyltransferase involved in cell wall biosynthesis